MSCCVPATQASRSSGFPASGISTSCPSPSCCECSGLTQETPDMPAAPQEPPRTPPSPTSHSKDTPVGTPLSSRSPDQSAELDGLLRRVHAIMRGESPDMPVADAVIRGEMRCRQLNEQEQYDIGYAEGFE